MMLFFGNSAKKQNKVCLICSERLADTISSPDICKDVFHYKCLRNYVDDKLDNKHPVICPETSCKQYFSRIANKYKKSEEIVYQNVVLSNDETTCCICFSKYRSPVATSDSCTHTFCCECIKKWCTFKHECPMDRMPIKLLLISDFPGGHVVNKIEPPAIEQDLSGDGDNDDITDTACEVCHSGLNEHQLLLCDFCNRGYHIYCLPTPLSDIPDGDWYCEECRAHASISYDNSIAGRRLPRGLGRIIVVLQDRFTRSNALNHGTRNDQGTQTAGLLVPNSQRIEQIVQSNNYVSNEIVLRTRSGVVPGVTDGTRTRRSRQLRNDVLVNDTVATDSPDISQSNISSNNSTITPGTSSELLEEEIEPINRRIRTRATTIERRRNDGRSLIERSRSTQRSDIETNIEPRRKRGKMKVSSTLYDSSSEEDNDMKSTSNDDDKDDETEPSKYLAASAIPSRINEALESALSRNLLTPPSRKMKPSTSRRKKLPKLKPVTKRKSKKCKLSNLSFCKKKKLKRGKRKRTTSTSGNRIKKTSEHLVSPSKLSVTGRENILPWLSDEEQCHKDKTAVSSQGVIVRPISCSGSILSEISDRQNNLRNMSLSTIKRLSDGTVVHNPVAQVKPISSVKKTPINICQASTSVKPIDKNPELDKSILSIKNVSKVARNEDVSVPSHSSEAIITPPKKVQLPLDGPSTSQQASKVFPSTSSPASHNTHLAKYVYNSLQLFCSDHKIDKEEFKRLNDKIMEKITRKVSWSQREKNVKDFVAKYMSFYLTTKNRRGVK